MRESRQAGRWCPDLSLEETYNLEWGKEWDEPVWQSSPVGRYVPGWEREWEQLSTWRVLTEHWEEGSRAPESNVVRETRNCKERERNAVLRAGRPWAWAPRVLGRSDATEDGARQGEHERESGWTWGMWAGKERLKDPCETGNMWELERTCLVEWGEKVGFTGRSEPAVCLWGVSHA